MINIEFLNQVNDIKHDGPSTGSIVMEVLILISNIVGTFLLIWAFAAQAIQIYKTKNTAGISFLLYFVTFVMEMGFTLWGILYIVNGYYESNNPSYTESLQNWQISTGYMNGFVTALIDFIAGLLCAWIMYYKARNLYLAKKLNIKEEELPKYFMEKEVIKKLNKGVKDEF